MRKILAAVFVIILSIAFPISASAVSDNVYTVDELGMNITMPQGWDVFTRDMQANQPMLEEYQMDQAAFEETLQTNNIYLDAYNPETGDDIYVIGIQDSDTEGLDYRCYSKPLMDNLVAQLQQDPSSNGADISWFSSGENNFCYLVYGGSQPTLVQCITLADGINITLLLQNESDSPITNEDIAALRQTIDSIQFTSSYDKSSAALLNILPTDFSFEGIINMLNSMYSFSLSQMIIPACIGAPVAIFLVFLYFKRKKGKPLQLSARQAKNLNGIHGPLILFAIKNILFLCAYAISICSSIAVYNMGATSYLPFIIIASALTVIYLIQTLMFFKKAPAYYLFYIIVNIAISIACFVIASPNSFISAALFGGMLVYVAIEALFMVYWVLSKRVMITFQTRQTIINDVVDPQATTTA